MSFRDDALAILTGGLPNLLDGATTQPIQAVPVEATPPEPQLQDREAFNLAGVQVSQPVVLGVGAAIVALIGVLAFARR